MTHLLKVLEKDVEARAVIRRPKGVVEGWRESHRRHFSVEVAVLNLKIEV